MHKNQLLAAILIIILLSAFTVSSNKWKITNGYKVKFNTAGAKGSFEKISGTIDFDEKNVEASSFDVNIEVASIATGNFMKTSHAKSEKWFNAEKFPIINFKSNKITKTASSYNVSGKLTMHGVSKQINIPFSFANNTFTGTLSANRMDYGVGDMEGMSKKVGNKVEIQISVPVSK